MNIGFDNQKYLQMQSAHIRERISMFGDKLYLEFGGKLFDDYHAARVLPGFEPDSKLKMLLQLKDQEEIVIAISASALETNKTRRDLGLTYRSIPQYRSLRRKRCHHTVCRSARCGPVPQKARNPRHPLLYPLYY